MLDHKTQVFYLSLDDTDTLGTPGTGHHARHVAELLADRGAECAVSRHQLLVHPDVPMTKCNSANVIHVCNWDRRPDEAFALACEVVGRDAADGSDPAVAVASDVPDEVRQFGRRAQEVVLKPCDARDLAAKHGVRLKALRETDDGLVGALAGLALATGGQDGRFVMIGRVRELAGAAPVHDVYAAGVMAVCLADGTPVYEGVITPAEKIRPAIVDHQPVLYVERRDDGTLAPMKLDRAPCYR